MFLRRRPCIGLSPDIAEQDQEMDCWYLGRAHSRLDEKKERTSKFSEICLKRSAGALKNIGGIEISDRNSARLLTRISVCFFRRVHSGCFFPTVVGWGLDHALANELALQAVQMPSRDGNRPRGLVHHRLRQARTAGTNHAEDQQEEKPQRGGRGRCPKAGRVALARADLGRTVPLRASEESADKICAVASPSHRSALDRWDKAM
jgi:hypothetical protein